MATNTSALSSEQTKLKTIELLNELSNATENNAKLEKIICLQELFISYSIEDDDFLNDVLSYSHDPSSDVRKTIISFIDQVCKNNVLTVFKTLDVLVALICDTSPLVIKKVIQVLTGVYTKVFSLLCQPNHESSDDLEQAWNKFSFIKQKMMELLDNDNDGIRTNAVKFLERVVLLQTYRGKQKTLQNDLSLDDICLNTKLLRRKKLFEDEALNIFDTLIKFHGTSHISAVNLIVATGSLCNIGRLRSNLLQPVLEAIGSLLNRLPPTLTSSQVNSVKKHIRLQFFNILKITDSVELQTFIVQHLQNLGCTIDEIKKSIPKKEKNPLKTKRTEDFLQHTSSKRHCKGNDQPDKQSESHSATKISKRLLYDQICDIEKVIELTAFGLKNLPNQMPSISNDSLISFSDISNAKRVIIDVIWKDKGKHITNQEKADLSSVHDQETEYEKKTVPISDKLKETLDRMKGDFSLRQHNIKSKIEPRLQNALKVTPKKVKLDLLNMSISNIINYDVRDQKSSQHKQRKILAAIHSTFIPETMEIVFNNLMLNNDQAIDLSLLCIYEEYSLQHGFIRHSYHLDDLQQKYEKTFIDILQKSCKSEDEVHRSITLRDLYYKSPHLTETCFQFLKSEMNDRYKFKILASTCKEIAVRKNSFSLRALKVMTEMMDYDDNEKRDILMTEILEIYEINKNLRLPIRQFAMEQFEKLMIPDSDQNILEEGLVRTHLRLGIELISKEPDILNKVVMLYIQSPASTKRLILKMIEGPMYKLEQNNSTVLSLITNCTDGAETLITRIVYILTDKVTACQELTSCVKNLYYNKINDVRLLIPIINKLTKAEVCDILPKIIQLSPLVLKEALNRLFKGSSLITPSELLVFLHTIELNPTEAKFIIKAISVCLSEKNIFTHDVIAGILQQLSEKNPMPNIMMRTVIQSLALYPKLSGFVINLLQRLILKQVWKQKLLWEGFVKCCQRLLPASLGVIVQIPPPQLLDALTLCPDLKTPLYEYVDNINESGIGSIPQHVMDVIYKTSDNKDTKLNSSYELEPPGIK